MAEAIRAIVKLHIQAGKATPSPPVGPALGQHGVNIMDFCNKFNHATKDQPGMIIPVVISIFQDRSFSYIMKTPPASILLKKAAGIVKASGEPNKIKIGIVKKSQVLEIANRKMVDLNANDIDGAYKIIAGTARSMGIEIEE